ncbi:tumor necrosis factor receptor superfamily member 19L-like [Lethenteron reissneri]|uniref:tumor necrosis factor receptor superfamily member 19L-like n=1 Tax=Lethenteron reissneri TaxID=7753 RepID=UPI002AB7CF4A|nr:tumor necrosis factor receptor superfamily member 19L-like [Lethenteron reissneri]XP_061408577.1 tumor necrosis factor receptor superfamily member 19L-like [Lethenteron reissneri]
MRTKPSHLYLYLPAVSCLLVVMGLPPALPLPAPCAKHEYRDPHGTCAPCPRCPPGQELDQECGAGRGGLGLGCRPCPQGTFSAAGTAPCVPHAACAGRLSRSERKRGSMTADSECGPCLPGFFSPGEAGDASPPVPCSPCSAAPAGTAACDGGTTTSPTIITAPSTEAVARTGTRGGKLPGLQDDPVEAPGRASGERQQQTHGDDRHHHDHHHQQQEEDDTSGGSASTAGTESPAPRAPGPGVRTATATPPAFPTPETSESAAVVEGSPRPLPDFGFFVLVPVFGLTGLLGVLVCHTLKARRARGATESVGGGGGGGGGGGSGLAGADCKEGASLLLPTAQYYAGNEDTIGQLVKYFLHKNGNVEALQALAMECGRLETTDSMASGFCSPSETPQHCQLSPLHSPPPHHHHHQQQQHQQQQAPPPGWLHAHTVHASHSRCACTRCRHTLWTQLPWTPCPPIGARTTPSRQGRPADAAGQAIGRFRVSQIPEQREWGSAAEEKNLLEMSDSDGDDSASGHMALDNPGGPGAPQSHHPLPRAQTDTKLCLLA